MWPLPFPRPKEEQRLKKELAALKTGGFLSSDIHTACDLNSAFAMLVERYSSFAI
jgi:hypothetical protein